MDRIAAVRIEAEKADKKQKESLVKAKKLAIDFGKSFGLAASYQQSLLGGWAQMGKMIDSDTDIAEAFNEQMRETFTAANIGASTFAKILEMSVASAMAYDSATADFNKATGAAGRFNEEISDATIGMASMGVGIAGLAAAYGALFSEMSNFTSMSKESRMVLGKTVATLENLGISGQLTAVNLEFLTKNMGMGATEAAKHQEKLAEFANTIGVAPAKMADEFKAAQPIMAKYGQVVGDKMFKSLAKTAKATGIELQSLLGIASQFDTFESAAQAAGKLNAMLGGPMLNSVELLTANEAERIDMLRQAVSESGKSFGAMNRFEQQAIANAAGITDMTEAARLFGTTDAEFAANAEEQANMAEMTAKAQSAQAKLNTLMMQFAAHIAPVVEAISDFLSKVLEVIDGMGWWGKAITTTILSLGLLQAAISAYTVVKNLQIVALLRGVAAQTLSATWAAISSIAIGLWTAVLWLANAAVTALAGATFAAAMPVWALVAAFLAVVAIVVLVIYYWDDLTLAVKTATDSMYDMWDVLLLVGTAIALVAAAPAAPFIAAGLAIALVGKKIYENWDALIASGKQLWGDFTGWLKDIWSDWSSFSLFTFDVIASGWDRLMDGLAAGFKWFANQMIDAWNFAGSVLSIDQTILPDLLGGGTIGPWRLMSHAAPMLAEGGTITSSGVAIVGEKGPEMLQLPKAAEVQPLKSAPATGGGTPTTIKLILNDREFGKAVMNVLNEKINLRTG
jgi:hypothetical protein